VDGGLGAGGGGGLDLRFDLDLGLSFERRWVRDGIVVVIIVEGLGFGYVRVQCVEMGGFGLCG
jgi:hypothetical protein